jgi:hypothetical protein
MDSKLLNYSKLQIPVLNGVSSHNYVIMPALLSQIDSTLSSSSSQNIEEDQSSNNNGYYIVDSYNNDIDNTQQTETVFIKSNSTVTYSKNKKSNRKSNKISKKKSKSIKETNNGDLINYGVDLINDNHLIDLEDDNNEEQEQEEENDEEDDEVDEEDLGLNSKLISKFIYKETEHLIDNFTNNELLNTNTIDSFTTNSENTISNDNNNNLFDNNNVIDLQNDDSDTCIVRCHLMPDIDVNQMMNCYVALNKLNDDNIGKNLSFFFLI